MGKFIYKIFALNRAQIYLFGLTIFASTLLISLFFYSIHLTRVHPVTFVTLVFPDAVLLWLPMLLLWPRAKWSGAAVIIIATLFLYCNILYYHNFGNAISSLTFTLASTIDQLIIRSALASIRVTDVVFLLPGLIATYSYMHWGKQASLSRLPRFFKPFIFTVFFLIVSVAQCALCIVLMRPKPSNKITDTVNNFFSLRTDFNTQLYFHGISVGYLCDFMTSHVAYKEISIDDIEKIKQWTGSTIVGSTDHCIPRNLIFIIVESLNTKAIEWEYNGRMAMPFLNSLIADSASITFTSMYPQAGLGRSSDGQMMYLTGIYPSKGTPMSIIAPYGPYPSLARLFPKNADTFEIIYESAGLWNHSLTHKAYGFKQMYDNITSIDKKSNDADSLVFANAKDIIGATKNPFFAVITTIGMHQPYNREYKKTWFSDLGLLHSNDKNYLEACSAFDSALSDFINWIKTTDLWENSVLVIASDHEALRSGLGPEMKDLRILLTILNSKLKGFHSDKIVGQIDVYPTIVDIMNLTDANQWHGFGHSLIRDIPGYAIGHNGIIEGDTIGKGKDVARQYEAIELSQRWIKATNKESLTFMH